MEYKPDWPFNQIFKKVQFRLTYIPIDIKEIQNDQLIGYYIELGFLTKSQRNYISYIKAINKLFLNNSKEFKNAYFKEYNLKEINGSWFFVFYLNIHGNGNDVNSDMISTLAKSLSSMILGIFDPTYFLL